MPCPLYHSGAAGIDIIGRFVAEVESSGHGSAVSLQLIGVVQGHVPCPLYHSGAAGIDIIGRFVAEVESSGYGSAVSLQLIAVVQGHCRVLYTAVSSISFGCNRN